MNPKKIEDLLDRYLKKTTTVAENELIESWLEAHDQTDLKWKGMDRASRTQWLDQTFNQISGAIGATDDADRKLPMSRKWVFAAVGAVAASLLVAVLLNWELPAISRLWKAEALTTQVTHKGQKSLVVLADGSRVWVNENSELRYPKQFDGNTREVYLTGEAYFDVAHNAQKTFIIHNGTLTTTVLGTAFNIKEDKRNHTIAVTVTRGKVSVADDGKPLAFVTPNQRLSFNLLKHQVEKLAVDAAAVTSWKNVDLHFDDVTFGEGVERLSLHFGVAIRFSNEKLKHCRFSGTNLAQQSLDEIIKVMCAFNGASYAKNKDGSILISGAGCD